MALRRTKNANLQTQLDAWVAALTAVSALPMDSPERLVACVEFCRTFVASDVEEDDVQYFANNIATDEEFFESLVRDLSICAAGDKVEGIGGNQKRKAIFTLRPIEDSEYDIVREVAFISSDNGTTWRAEGDIKPDIEILVIKKENFEFLGFHVLNRGHSHTHTLQHHTPITADKIAALVSHYDIRRANYC